MFAKTRMTVLKDKLCSPHYHVFATTLAWTTVIGSVHELTKMEAQRDWARERERERREEEKKTKKQRVSAICETIESGDSAMLDG